MQENGYGLAGVYFTTPSGSTASFTCTPNTETYRKSIKVGGNLYFKELIITKTFNSLEIVQNI